MILLKNALITMVIKYLKYTYQIMMKKDLHSRITELLAAKLFKEFYKYRSKADNTIFTYENGSLTIEEIKDDCDLIKYNLN